MSDDAELLRCYAAKGDEAAFAELVRRHVDLVYSAALRRVGGDEHAAADVTQHVFVALARRAGTLGRGGALPAWLYATTRNVAVDVVRRERRRREREQEAQMSALHSENDEPAAEWERLRPLLDAAMDELGERDREAVVLRFFARQPFAEIGRALGLSEDAARMRVERALEKLRGRLGRRGVTSTAAALGLALGSHACGAAPAGLEASATVAALAGAAAGGPATGLLVFMGTIKFQVGTAAVFVALLGTAVFLRHEWRGDDVALAAEGEMLRAGHAELRALGRRADALAAEIATLRRETEAAAARERQRAAAASAPVTEEPRPSTPARSPVAEGNAFMTRHPAVRQALEDWADGTVNARYGALFASLGLDEAQRAAFRALLRSMAFVPDAEPDEKVLQLNAGPRLSRDEVQRRLHALLGPEGYRAYQEFDGRLRAREFTTELAAALAFSETPLAPAQAQQLIQLLHAAGAGRDAPQSDGAVDWDAALRQARPILSPAQFAALEGVRAGDRYSVAWRRLPNPFGPANGDRKK